MIKVEKLDEKKVIAALEKVNGALSELKTALGYTSDTDLLEKEISLESYDSPLRMSDIVFFAEDVKGCQAKFDEKYTELKFSSFAEIESSFPVFELTGQSMYYHLLDAGTFKIIPDIAFFWEHLRSYGAYDAKENLVYNTVEAAKKQIANEGNFELLTHLSTLALVEVKNGEVVNHISDDIVSDYVYSVHSNEDPCGEYDGDEPLYTNTDMLLVCVCIAVCKNMRP